MMKFVLYTAQGILEIFKSQPRVAKCALALASPLQDLIDLILWVIVLEPKGDHSIGHVQLSNRKRASPTRWLGCSRQWPRYIA